VDHLRALLAQVIAELETSTKPERRALLRRVQEGTHTPKDVSEVADLIEELIARADGSGRN
jgi:hypothetical protein